MRPRVWRPSIEPTPAESMVMQRVKRAKPFVFLRKHRHDLFDERFQEELGEIYRESRLGQPPVPPAKLALATILQAYTGVSDDEAIEAMVMDRRWRSWYSGAWTPRSRPSLRVRSWPSAKGSSSTRWIDVWWNAPWRSPL